MTAHPKPSAAPLSKERLRLWLKLLKTSRSIEDEVRRRLRREHDWTLPRFDVMSALSRAPDGLKMGEISRMLKVSGGNITGIVDKLTQEGLALRVAIPGDRRANLVRLTDKGHEMFARHSVEHEAWINDILGGLDADDVSGMIVRLDRLNDTLAEDKNAD
ncbi:MarR family winged helix-turn-helix transcriptional regulator [Sagittula stellata]|uniref:Transcriptional regulator, MarR family protein n=1 Tax=Sagittula stellata (strain ATCC 700073 / DSM 11524 / E-37) TaxID=388399 RepID=A3K785_SAGS3|nr:MarR family transcriptional regulator [Sagittula stellata]EBA06844.1 transcriptional regulator, MarR family protein [Sagittula stellata E-37]